MAKPKGHKAKQALKSQRMAERATLNEMTAESEIQLVTPDALDNEIDYGDANISDGSRMAHDRAVSAWWNAMPGEKGDGNSAAVQKRLFRRGRWLLQKRLKPRQDSKYGRLQNELRDAHEKVLAGYGQIDPAIAEGIRAAQTRLLQRVEQLIENGTDPRGDGAIEQEIRTVSREENLLTQIWIEIGERRQFKNPAGALPNKDPELRRIAAERIAYEERMDKADRDREKGLLEEEAEALARANTRGALAPMRPVPRCLVSAIEDFMCKANALPTGNVFECAKFIRLDDCRTWPTLHDCVLAFAANGETLRKVIARMPDSPAKRITANRPRRYSPAIIRHLIDWWLAQNRKNASPDDYAAGIFERVKALLPRS